MAPAPVRIAVVGLGIMGMRHAQCVATHPDAILAVVADLNAEKRAAAEHLGAIAVADLDALPGRADAAIIATPTGAHAEIAIRLLNAGIPCLVEKPFVMSASEGARVIAAAKTSNMFVQVGHIERSNPAIVALLARIAQEPAIGSITARRINGASARVTDIDVIMDLMVHDIDVVLAVKGHQIAKVDASGSADHAQAKITFADGQAAELTASRALPGRIRDLRVTMGAGELFADYIARTLSETDRQGHTRALPVPMHDALSEQLSSFIGAVRGGTVAVTADDAMATLDVAWRLQKALGLRG